MKKKLKLVLVGAGLVGRRHVDAIAKFREIELSAIVDPNESGKIFATERETPWFASISQMLESQRPDGVILATPTPLHVEQALECIEKRCAVLVEKPIATSSTEAEKLVARALQLDVPVLVGHHRRHNPLIQRAKRLIDDGRIGKVRAITATCWFYKPDSYFEVSPWRKKKGAGPISVNMVHDVDLIRHLCGEITSVYAKASPSSRGFENEELATAILTFANGAIGTISVADSIASPWSWEMTARENPAYPATRESSYLIGGSSGSLAVPDLSLWQHEEQPDWWRPMSASAVTCSNTDPLENQIGHFFSVIRDGETPLVSGTEGLRSLKVVEAVQRSAETGELVSLEVHSGESKSSNPEETVQLLNRN